MPTLLLADDSVTVQRVIALTFAKEQIRVVTVSDGTQAVERMKTLHPDIVLAGTVLPQVSGYDLAKHMRTIPGLRKVPVLLLSGAFETVDEEKLKESGVNGILEKPVEPNNVIARVKELLGLKSEPKPAMAGRLVTAVDSLPDSHVPPAAVPPRTATATSDTPLDGQPSSGQTGLEVATGLVDDTSTGSNDYLDTLDAAFDTLDQQLSGRVSAEKPPRNPSGPLGQAHGAADPRSPGRPPDAATATPPAANPVFEVDDDWFEGDETQARADARAGRREILEDLKSPDLHAPRPDAAPANAVFEIDDNWFAEADKARAAKAEEHRLLAAEMGVHDVDLPHAGPVPNAPAPPSDPDFAFGLDDIKNLQGAQAQDAPVLPVPDIPAPMTASEGNAAALELSDEFAQLLPVEQAQLPPSPAPAAPGAEVRFIAPEVTDAMLDQVAARVAERLSSGGFGEQLLKAVTATVNDTVREIASATSERLVREIASATSERLSREIASATSERLSREIASETSERLSREIASEASERLVPGIASEAAERLSRDIASETSARLSREIALEASERVSREIATESAERVCRDVATEASERLSREIATERSERLVREIATETSERLVREIASETSARVARDIVSETSERLVRDEIERIKSKARS